MIFILELDDSCVPWSGHKTAEFMLEAIKTDPQLFMNMAERLSVKCPFGQASEDR